MLLLRTAQAWVAQDDAAEPVEPDEPAAAARPGDRHDAVGGGRARGGRHRAVVGVLRAAEGPGPHAADRPVQAADPAVVHRRPAPGEPDEPGPRAVHGDRPTGPSSNYVSIASVDYYDGDGWSFDRTFRPTGGVIPGDDDPTLRPTGGAVTQQYTIDSGALTSTPWMPYLYRPAKVSGVSVDIDTASGMIVPSQPLHAGRELHRALGRRRPSRSARCRRRATAGRLHPDRRCSCPPAA